MEYIKKKTIKGLKKAAKDFIPFKILAGVSSSSTDSDYTAYLIEFKAGKKTGLMIWNSYTNEFYEEPSKLYEEDAIMVAGKFPEFRERILADAGIPITTA